MINIWDSGVSAPTVLRTACNLVNYTFSVRALTTCFDDCHEITSFLSVHVGWGLNAALPLPLLHINLRSSSMYGSERNAPHDHMRQIW
jgi:hypothetical protein